MKSIDLSFHNAYSLLKKIDTLPVGPPWTCNIMEITGDKEGDGGERQKEVLEFWTRDPLDCIRELISNPAFRDQLAYTPERAYDHIDGLEENRVWDEMWTGDWWWNKQVSTSLINEIGSLILTMIEQTSAWCNDCTCYSSIG